MGRQADLCSQEPLYVLSRSSFGTSTLMPLCGKAPLGAGNHGRRGFRCQWRRVLPHDQTGRMVRSRSRHALPNHPGVAACQPCTQLRGPLFRLRRLRRSRKSRETYVCSRSRSDVVVLSRAFNAKWTQNPLGNEAHHQGMCFLKHKVGNDEGTNRGLTDRCNIVFRTLQDSHVVLARIFSLLQQ